ncbi:MAG: NAD(P)/FAD-dependent oxidoreductase [Pedosphaera sp.]|nr:NAD(P)/FAD-dependent oxidoreductase [Pedosphaera sp.]MSU44362.1 NAD(P)/FAD-dependent oxidoreductase [Pedosphaera sp.]
MQSYDVIVAGGGAAGLMCAITAGRRGHRVLVLERAQRLGNKILISGGGRCNFTNLRVGPENYLSTNPHFCRSALAGFAPEQFIELVRRHRIAFHEKTLGQLFCDISSRQIMDLLRAECAAAGVEIQTDCQIDSVTQAQGYQLHTSRGPFGAAALVIATGALSFPKLGATHFGHRIAAQFGVNVIEPRPGLVPLIPELADGQRWPFGALSGISLDVIASSNGASFRENMLFTHRGLSGPAILQVSNYCPVGSRFRLDLLPGRDATALAQEARRSNRTPGEWLAQLFPSRFAQDWAAHFTPDKLLSQCSARELDELVARLKSWELRVIDTEGYGKAEVTVGGVDTRELSSKTLECRRVPGLYFIGEVVDVTGWLGGYNFQWAWASGHAAGQAV